MAGELDLTVPEPVAMRTATQQDVPAAARVLTAAFADYPWTRWTVPADDRRAARTVGEHATDKAPDTTKAPPGDGRGLACGWS